MRRKGSSNSKNYGGRNPSRQPRKRDRHSKKGKEVSYIKKSHLAYLKDAQNNINSINETMLNKSNEEYLYLLEKQLEQKSQRIKDLEKDYEKELEKEEYELANLSSAYTRSSPSGNIPIISGGHTDTTRYSHRRSPQNRQMSSHPISRPTPLSNPSITSTVSIPSKSFFDGFGKGGGGASLQSPISKDRVKKLREDVLRESPHEGVTRNYKRFKFELRSYEEQTKMIENELKKQKFAESLREQIEMKNRLKGENADDNNRSSRRRRQNDNQTYGNGGGIFGTNQNNNNNNPTNHTSSYNTSPTKEIDSSSYNRYENTPAGPNFGIQRRRKVSLSEMKNTSPELRASPSKVELSGSSQPNFFLTKEGVPEKMAMQRLKLQMELEQHNVKKEEAYTNFLGSPNDMNLPSQQLSSYRAESQSQSQSQQQSPSRSQRRIVGGGGRKRNQIRASPIRRTGNKNVNRKRIHNNGNRTKIHDPKNPKYNPQRQKNMNYRRGRKSKNNGGIVVKKRRRREQREDDNNNHNHQPSPSRNYEEFRVQEEEEEVAKYALDRKRSWKEDFMRLKDEIREEREEIREILHGVVKEVRERRSEKKISNNLLNHEHNNSHNKNEQLFAKEMGGEEDGLSCKSYFVPVHPHGRNLLSQIWDGNKKNNKKNNNSGRRKGEKSLYEKKRFVRM